MIFYYRRKAVNFFFIVVYVCQSMVARVMRVSRPLTKKRLKSMQEAERERDEGCAVIGDSIDAAEVPFPHCHGNQDDSTGAAGERMT